MVITVRLFIYFLTAIWVVWNSITNNAGDWQDASVDKVFATQTRGPGLDPSATEQLSVTGTSTRLALAEVTTTGGSLQLIGCRAC